MRWSGLLACCVAMFALAGFTATSQAACLGCGQGTVVSPWESEACASPAGYTLAPGCCPEHRRCCDNAWAGYCEHRAKVEACWARAGTNTVKHHVPLRPGAPCIGNSNYYYGDSCTEQPAIQSNPTPAAPMPPTTPAPPVPNQNTRNLYNNRVW